MSASIRTRIVKIGNSRGVRIPRTLLEQAGLGNDVEMVVQGDKLIIQSARRPRQGWASQFASMAETGDDRLLDETLATSWDQEEWDW